MVLVTHTWAAQSFTFFRSTKSFSAAVLLLISSSYLLGITKDIQSLCLFCLLLHCWWLLASEQWLQQKKNSLWPSRSGAPSCTKPWNLPLQTSPSCCLHEETSWSPVGHCGHGAEPYNHGTDGVCLFFNGHPIQPPVMKRNCPWQLHTAEHRAMAVTSRTTSPLILRPQQKSSKVKDQVVPKSGLSAAYQLRRFSIFALLVEQINPIIPG